MAALLADAGWLVLVTTSAAAQMEAAIMLGFLWMQSGFLGITRQAGARQTELGGHGRCDVVAGSM